MSTRLTRREFVGAATVASLPLLTGLPSLAAAEQMTAPRAPHLPPLAPDPMDHDMLEITVDGLHALYDAKKYTVTQVTHYYLARIARYNPVYRALLHVDTAGALKTAAAQDAAAKAGGARFKRTALWGVPIVIKANTSVKGLVTSAGWSGYLIPGLELIAPQDAPVVAKLRAAGAVILGQTNMPDFAASDTNMSTAFGRTGNAYNPRFSPGGSSGGTVTAVTANLCVLGTGTDTANSIRMPAATSCVVGVLPTRGLVSIAGIQPLDWLRDNTGPIARDVRDTAIALTVMAGEDSKDFQTKGSTAQAEPGPYTKYLNAGAIKGKRFGVPAFMMTPATPGGGGGGGTPLQPETRDMFMKGLDALRAAGATVVIDDNLLPASFAALARSVSTRPYLAEGTELFLRDFGPPEYHSIEEYEQVMGTPMPGTVTGIQAGGAGRGGRGGPPAAATAPAGPKQIETDPAADATFFGPQRAAIAAYNAALDQFKLDGLVYPAIQMPPNDEIAVVTSGGRSSGPHSDTGWVNEIGVPAISVPAGFYDSGLPFNLEFSAKRWRDGDLIGWVYAFEQATHARKPPVLVENTMHRRPASTP
jgi:Asp-tRNA(Asn)/Glu-tRNA(Gln) amidotransferase A subunit family amidase